MAETEPRDKEVANVQMENQNTMEMFLERALRSIFAEATTKRTTRLRESCHTTLELISKHGVTPTPNDTREHIEQVDKVMNKLVITLRLACHSGQASVVSKALDCLQKLMAYGYVRNSIKDIEKPERKLMEKVIETIGECFDFEDDNVQIQIIKAFLTAVSSPICQIHERPLMNAIRACFNIYLISASAVTQMTAKATLSQMLNVIFQRLENVSVRVHDAIDQYKQEHGELPEPTPPRVEENEIASVPLNTLLQTATAHAEEEEESRMADLKPEYKMSVPSFIDPNLRHKLNTAYVDAFLSFRALCKLSMKEIAPSAAPNSIDMRRKQLALELLQNILENAGPQLQKNEQFVDTAIKKFLFISLLVNGVSPFIRIFRVSLDVFSALIVRFKDHLKTEIGVFFAKILLRILGSDHSSMHHRHAILLLLQKICQQAQMLVDMFLNYDCHMESVDIFERMVNELSSMAKGLTSHNAVTINHRQHANTVRILALDCLVTIMRSLVQWSSELTAEESKADAQGSKHQRAASSSSDPKLEPNAEEGTGDDADTFTQAKQRKHQVEHGKVLFNQKPRTGIDYLVEVGYLQRTPKDVAAWLLNAEGLDLTQIGDYLGNISNPFCKSVLYEYVDLQRFENMEIYTALRRFLLGFRLPGEGQKIDVIMEKFAERYYHDNQKQPEDARPTENGSSTQNESGDFVFANADAVYIFAYHMIMLATDLHHKAVKNKISEAEWIKNNRGLNDGKDFPEEFLLSIYHTVSKYPLKTRDDPPVGPNNADVLTPRQRQILFLKETKSIVQRSQEMIEEKLEQKSIFFQSSNIQHVKPMFSMSWCPMLAAFSMNLEVSQDHEEEVYSMCLEGFRCAIRVSSIFFMETERNAFVTSLSQFTLLSNLREMRRKNIQAIKCLIQIAYEDGNYLQGSWAQVLNCISQLAKLQILGKSMRHMEQVATAPRGPPPASLNDNRLASLASISSSSALPISESIEGLNASAVMDQIDLGQIDRLFSHTVHLNDNAIVDFVQCLCDTSTREVTGTTTDLRTFCLQKLIEVASYNMERIRFVWTRIWCIMAAHFEDMGCHKDQQIAMYAVDSLRQLAMKFLEKDELANYHFQKDFLKPFEHIVTHNETADIRELVVSCLSQMILARAHNIRSGWKSIFMVFTFVAPGNLQAIVFLAYQMQEKIMNEYFSLISTSFFVECVHCLTAFALNRHFKEVSIRAIESIGFCAKELAEGRVLFDEEKKPITAFTPEDQHLRHWTPILSGLAQVVSHPHIDVRTSALDRLFNILLKYGNLFNAALWDLIFQKVLLSIFSEVLTTTASNQGQLQHTSEWVTSTCLGTLGHLIELFAFFFERIDFLTDDYLVLLSSFVLQENFHLSSIGSTCLLQFIESNATKWSPAQWYSVATALQFIVEEKLCRELLSIGQPKKPPTAEESLEDVSEDSDVIRVASVEDHATFVQKLKAAKPLKHRPLDVKPVAAACSVQLLLLSTVREVLTEHWRIIPNESLPLILGALRSNYEYAKTLNSKPAVWKATGKSEIMSLLVKAESASCSTYLDILFWLYASDEQEKRDMAEPLLLRLLNVLMTDYMEVDNSPQNYPQTYAESKVPVLLRALQGFHALQDEQFSHHLPEFYDLLCELILVREASVRSDVRQLIQRVGSLNQFFTGDEQK